MSSRPELVLRPARAVDAIAVAELLAARGRESVYAGLDEVDVPYARKMLARAVQRHGGTTDGATFFMVAEQADEIVAFVLASLGRVYGVGHKLAACDHYLLGRNGGPRRALRKLLDQYIAWASANPRVIEIGASFSDAFPGSEAWAAVFRRLGFKPCAQTYRRLNAAQTEGGDNV